MAKPPRLLFVAIGLMALLPRGVTTWTAIALGEQAMRAAGPRAVVARPAPRMWDEEEAEETLDDEDVGDDEEAETERDRGNHPQNLVGAPDTEPARTEELRTQGYRFLDRLTGESVRGIGSCRYEVKYRGSQSVGMLTDILELGCDIAPGIGATVERMEDGRYRYSYVVSNQKSAQQRVIKMEAWLGECATVVEKSEVPGWRLTLAGTFLSLAAMDWGSDALRPGREVGPLVISSDCLPGVSEAIFAGVVDGPPRQIQGEFGDRVGDAVLKIQETELDVHRVMIAPVIPPPNGEKRSATRVLQDLIKDVARARSAGMIGEPAAQRLTGILAAATAGSANERTLGGIAEEIGKTPGLDDRYAHSLEAALKALAEPR